MKKLSIFTLALGTAFLVSCGGGEEAEQAMADLSSEMEAAMNEAEASANEEASYAVNTENSTIGWTGSMMGMYDHTGKVNVKEGSITTKGGSVTGGSITIDMASMVATDENFSEEKTSDMLIGHLSSPDFFDIESNPTASFTIKSVEGDVATGDLTIRGTTKEATVSGVTVSEENGVLTAKGTLTFNRQDFGVAYATGAADKVISDDVNLTIELSADKAAS